MRRQVFRVSDAKETIDLVKDALAQMWPIPQSSKEEVVQKHLEIIRDEFIPQHVRVMAARNILAMAALNLKAIDTVIKASGLQSSNQVDENIQATPEELKIGVRNLLTDTSANGAA